MAARGALFSLDETGSDYVTVAASQTGAKLTQPAGNGGAKGDVIRRIIIIPTTTSPGVVTLIDGAISIVLFNGGASSLTELKPLEIYVGMASVTGAWTVTTGANVAIIAVGKFT